MISHASKTVQLLMFFLPTLFFQAAFGGGMTQAAALEAADIAVAEAWGGWSGSDRRMGSVAGTLAIGKPAWAKTYAGPGGAVTSSGHDLAVDASGSVYIAGEVQGTDNSKDLGILKYNKNGKFIWAYRTFLDGSYESGNHIKLDQWGNIYVAGQYSPSRLGLDRNDVILCKYDKDGQFLWWAPFNGVGNGEDWVGGLAVNANGEVYVAGTTYAGEPYGFDYFLVKYDTAGNKVWDRRLYNKKVKNGDDYLHDMTVDSAGNVFVTGRYMVNDSSSVILTASFDPGGNLRWSKQYGPASPAPGYGHPTGMNSYSGFRIANAGGYLAVTGIGYRWSNPLQTSLNVTILYNVDGRQAWVRVYERGKAHNDKNKTRKGYVLWDDARLFAVDVNVDGQVFTACATGAYGKEADITVMKQDADGWLKWLWHYNRLPKQDGFDAPTAIKTEGPFVYLLGLSWSALAPNNYSDILYLKFAADNTGRLQTTKAYDSGKAADDVPQAMMLWNNFLYATGYAGGSVVTVKFQR